MQRKIRELTGAALNYAVALAEGGTDFSFDTVATYWITIAGKDRALSGGWAQSFTPSAGPDGDDIIDREGITVIRCDDDYGTDAQGFTTSERIPVWAATLGQHGADEIFGGQGDSYGSAYTLDVTDVVYGATRREAAMRAWAIHKLGRCGWSLNLNLEIDIPEVLCS